MEIFFSNPTRYYRDNRTRYVYGQLNSDEAYNGRGLALSMEHDCENVLMQARAMSEILTALPGSFHGTLKAHMKRLNVTRERLAGGGVSLRFND